MSGIEYHDDGVAKLFDALTEVAANPADAMREIGDDLASSTRLRFLEGRDPDGAAWKPLALSTLIKRASRGRSMARGGPLVGKTGRFRKAFAQRIAGGGQPLMDTRTHLFNTVTYSVQDGGKSVVVGVAPPWARIHQFGGQAGRGHKVTIPARRFLGVSARDRGDIVAILTRRVLEKAGVSLGAAT